MPVVGSTSCSTGCCRNSKTTEGKDLKAGQMRGLVPELRLLLGKAFAGQAITSALFGLKGSCVHILCMHYMCISRSVTCV